MATQPPIFEAQNTADARRLVAAQARMYSDAKRLFFGRIVAVFILAIAAVVTASIWEPSRLIVGGAGGIALFLCSFLAEAIEKRKRLQASGAQELFDTRVFQIPWNELNFSRPSSAAVAQAAARYSGGRDKDWYVDTCNVKRPFDILICQATNLGWGATMHRLWAWLLVAFSSLLVVLIGVVWYLYSLDLQSALLVLLVPALAPFKELIGIIRNNFEAANSKEEAERSLNSLWDRGMSDSSWVPSPDVVRSIQDKLLALRRENSYVPDWLDRLFYTRNEAAMRTSVYDKIQHARRSGQVE